MSPGKVSRRSLLDRAALANRMQDEIGKLPLSDREEFFSDSRNTWTCESCLRRMLEALLDMGRHILAKAYAQGVTEYKQIASELGAAGVLTKEESSILTMLAGYRNRMVHFYAEMTPDELYEVCSGQMSDLVRIRDAYLRWIGANPSMVEDSL